MISGGVLELSSGAPAMAFFFTPPESCRRQASEGSRERGKKMELPRVHGGSLVKW